MQNLFVGYSENGSLHGCKDYISNNIEGLKAEEMMNDFYRNHSKEQIKEKLMEISWEEFDGYNKENNGFPFMTFLSKDTIESYAHYHQNLMAKISAKKESEIQLYDPDFFTEENGTMYLKLTNHGSRFNEFEFDWVYIIDLDKDILVVEDSQNGTRQEITRKCL